MSSQEREEYQNFCKNNDVPVFMQDWYLDAVCDQGEWSACFSYNKNGQVQAILPYYLSTYKGFRVIKMPRLCPFMGIWIQYPAHVRTYKRMAFEKTIINELVEQLPKFTYYFQHYPYDFTNCLPLYWKGFQQTTTYTYILKKADNQTQQFEQFNRNIRRNIKKAAQTLSVSSDITRSQFYEVLSLTFERQNLEMPFSEVFFEQLHLAIEERKLGKMFVAKDQQGHVHAVSYLIWDNQSAYYHLAGDDPNFRQSGASILLTWEAIKFTFEELNLNTFDFLGSTIEPIEAIRRQFGAEQQAYARILKSRNRFFEVLRVLTGKF